MRPVVIEYDASAPDEVRQAAHSAAAFVSAALPDVEVVVREAWTVTAVRTVDSDPDRSISVEMSDG